MKVLKNLFLATSFFLLASPLHAVDVAPKVNEEGISPLGDRLSTSRSHRKGHHKSHKPKPVFLYASTPLNYVGQSVGTAPVPSGTTVTVNFPVTGETSSVLPVSENVPGIFTVLKKGQYLINWNILVQNPDAGGFNTAFGIVLLKNGIPQPPNLRFEIPPAFGINNNPNMEVTSGSIILKLKVGDTVQLNISSFSSSDLTIPLVVGAASINFIRL